MAGARSPARRRLSARRAACPDCRGRRLAHTVTRTFPIHCVRSDAVDHRASIRFELPKPNLIVALCTMLQKSSAPEAKEALLLSKGSASTPRSDLLLRFYSFWLTPSGQR